MNKVILIGNLGQDPKVRTLENGTIVATFSIATTEYWNKDGELQQETTWHEVVCWRKLGEKAEKQLHKGDTVSVEGALKYNDYTDSEGVKRKFARVVADKFTRWKQGSSNVSSFPTEEDAPPAYTPKAEASEQAVAPVEATAVRPAADDDLPF